MRAAGPDIMLGSVISDALSTWWVFATRSSDDESRELSHGRGKSWPSTPTSDATERRTPPPFGGVAQDALVSALRSSDESAARVALETIYLALFERLWRFAYLTVRHRDVAEEVTQDVFFALWQRRTTLELQGDIAVYLHTAVRYRAVKHVRHDRVVSRYSEESGQTDIDQPLVAHIEGPEEALSAGELERAFIDLLARVPDRVRQALVLRWRDGWTYEEIGETLGVSKVAVRALILRYQQRLQPFLDKLRQELEG